MTVFSTAILVGVALVLLRVMGGQGGLGLVFVGVSFAVLVCGFLFSIRGYRLDGASLYVLRPLWETAVDLRGLESAEIDPGAMRGAWRTFGNGGMFSFSGWHWSRKLGRHRAFVTDFKNAVVLRQDGRSVVISPGDPEAFLEDLGADHPHLLARRT